MEIIITACGAAAVTGAVQIILFLLQRKKSGGDEQSKRLAALEKAVNALLYERLKYLSRKYMRLGKIESEDLEDLMELQRIYREEMQGSEYLDTLSRLVGELPIKQKESLCEPAHSTRSRAAAPISPAPTRHAVFENKTA